MANWFDLKEVSLHLNAIIDHFYNKCSFTTITTGFQRVFSRKEQISCVNS